MHAHEVARCRLQMRSPSDVLVVIICAKNDPAHSSRECKNRTLWETGGRGGAFLEFRAHSYVVHIRKVNALKYAQVREHVR